MNKVMFDKEEILGATSKLYQEIVDAKEVKNGSIRDTVNFHNNTTATILYIDYKEPSREITFTVRLK